MNVDQMRRELDDLEGDKSLFQESNLEGRTKALDQVAFVQEILRMRGREEELVSVEQRAISLQRCLQEVDERLFRKLCADIRSKRYTPAELRREFNRYTDYSPQAKGQAHIGYDGLDVLVNGLVLVDPVPEQTYERPKEMIQYEATPARAILDLIDHVGLAQDDVFYDLGAGLGHIVILVSLLTGIRAKGIEIEPAFCDYARNAAQALGLSNVTFINADARDADYSDGTVVFMFTPFIGSILEAVLERLRRQSLNRAITICTFGSCTLHVARQPWLRSLDANANHEFKLAVFCST